MDGVVVRTFANGNNPPQSCGIKGVKLMAIDLIMSFIKATGAETLAFKALALANLNKTVNDIVSLILNHPSKDNNTPRWTKDEKGCGKKAGTAKIFSEATSKTKPYNQPFNSNPATFNFCTQLSHLVNI